MELEKLAHEITMLLLRCDHTGRPGNVDMAKQAARNYVVWKKAVIDQLQTKQP